jgi:anaerobic dimethyl sulfoxide reductase subunit B (iron-sulfur subunit)
MTYAFTFDASACSGCKACQIACKDKNQLPIGVLWRRVYEVSGGSWQRQNDAWTTDVFAYNLSLACNHCVHPKCAGVCPVDAYVVRDDGVVYINESKCMGCGYCSWACPYAAPRYNPELGHMTKCNFCYDNIDAGQPPACVAACPMRALNLVTVNDGPSTVENALTATVHRQMSQNLWEIPATQHPFPLPHYSHTEPHLAIRPHAGMGNALEKRISNREEVKSRHSSYMNEGKGETPKRAGRFSASLSGFEATLEELPLVAFTLLGQMAAGLAVFSWMRPPCTFELLLIGLSLGLCGLASFLHLGAKKNAWRAVTHWRKSWLSREILMFGLFGALWLVSLGERWFLNADRWPRITALAGIGFVYSMAQVYRLPSMPKWDTWRTPAGFFLAALALGQGAAWVGDSLAPNQATSVTLLALLGAEWLIWFGTKDKAHAGLTRLRGGLIVAALAGVGIGLAIGPAGSRVAAVVVVLILLEEIIGRWLFYAALDERALA